MSGRPKTNFPFKHNKEFHEAGRYYKRLEDLLAKKQKVAVMESLILMHETQTKPDFKYLRDLKQRTNEVRSQLRVLSTVEPGKYCE